MWLEIFDYMCLLTLFFEVLGGSIAFGFIARDGWLNHDLWNKMDFMILIMEITEFISSYTFLIGVTLRPLRIFRHLKMACNVPAMEHIKVIFATLWSSVTQLVIVFAILFLFLVTFSIFGMAMFQGSFTRS